jgi:hypothetical protein
MPALNGSGDALPLRIWTLSIVLQLPNITSGLVSLRTDSVVPLHPVSRGRKQIQFLKRFVSGGTDDGGKNIETTNLKQKTNNCRPG